MDFNTRNFSWDYRHDGPKIEFALKDCEPVYFDGSRPRIRKWLDARHKNGAMHEPTFSFVLARLIEKVDPSVYFDVGGFLGYFSIIPLPWVRREALIYCFEMNRTSCDLLRKSVALNTHLATSRVFVVNAGISSNTELAKKVWVDGFKLSNEGPNGEVNDFIDILSLDYVYKSMGIVPDLIKMDIEGFEAPAIAGASALFKEKRPTLIFELHSDGFLEPHLASRASVILMLESFGYTVFGIEGRRYSKIETDRPLRQRNEAANDGLAGIKNSSYVAIAMEKVDQFSGLIA